MSNRLESRYIRVLWKVREKNINWASVRIRTLIPAFMLSRKNVNISIVDNSFHRLDFSDFDVVIINKSFSYADVEICKSSKDSGCVIVIDICDNIFFSATAEEKVQKNFCEMVEMANIVVVPTSELKDKISSKVPSSVNFEIIPDSLEDEKIIVSIRDKFSQFQSQKNLKKDAVVSSPEENPSIYERTLQIIFNPISVPGKIAWRIKALYQFGPGIANRIMVGIIRKLLLRFEKSKILSWISPVFSKFISVYHYEILPDRRVLIWFGKSGSRVPQVGMYSLEKISKKLELINKRIPIQLLIVSDSLVVFHDVNRKIHIPTVYMNWSLDKIYSLIRKSDVCILPNSGDDAAVIKSPNRAILSLYCGTPVVADYYPGISSFSDCIISGDWEKGIENYLLDPDLVKRDIEKAKSVIEEKYTAQVVCEMWSDLLYRLVSNK